MSSCRRQPVLGALGRVKKSRQDTRKDVKRVRQDSVQITADNAHEHLHWIPEHGVMICSNHGYAIGSVEQHLRLYHSGSDAEKKIVAQGLAPHTLLNPRDVPPPPPLGRPFEALGKPKRAFICEETECEWLTVSRVEIRKHCNKEHGWKSSRQHREHWHQVWVQTFFSRAGLQRYFTVDYVDGTVEEEVVVEGASQQQFTSTQKSQDVNTVIGEWDKALEKQQKARETADAHIAKTDHTGWFTRTRWPEHLANSNLKHLSHATRLPDRDETVLHRAVELVDTLIERSVSGLATLDDETRRWLRSAKLHEPDVRPLSRLQNPESQAVYAGYMRRLLCYSLRVWRSSEEYVDREQAETRGQSESESENEDSEREGESRGSDGGDSEDSSSKGEGNGNGTRIVDGLVDARRLFPWQDSLQEDLKKIWNTIKGEREQQEQMQAVQEFFRQVIFRRVRGKLFDSMLLHFLAVLGINEETNRLREGNDFSYMLAGVVYCVRVLAVEILLPSAGRDEQTDDDDRQFREQRSEYLADGSYSVMSKMLSLLAYSKHVAMSHGNAGTVMWSRDGTEMTIRGMPIVLARFRKMVLDVVLEAEDLLWRKLMWAADRERFDIPLNKLEDDVTFTKRGISFISNPKNELSDKREWILDRALNVEAGGNMRRGGKWRMRRVRAYLREVDRFRSLLLFCVHLTGGQPARGTEITTVRFKNGYAQDRNVFAIHGHIVVVTRYHKSQSQFDKPKVIPRFLPWRVGQLLALYLAYVHPLHEYLSVQVKGTGWSEYVWSNEKGPWETGRLTSIIKRETESRLGVRLTTHDYRHTAISIGRRVVGESFARGYAEEMADIEEPEVDADDPLEMSAGRGGEIGANRYGVSLDVIKHLSSRTVDTFRPLSEKWHEFLGLPSYESKREKRKRDGGSSSAASEQDPIHDERRMAVALRNNGISGWNQTMARYAGFTPVEKRNREIVEEEVDARIERAARQVLGCEDFTYRSKEQEQALRTILQGELRAALVVVLPTGGGKSLLFMVPACVDDPGVTIVVVPYRALINNLVQTAQKAGIDCTEWRLGEANPASLVYVSADMVPFTGFMGYARLLQEKGLLRRVFVDECHLAFTASDWRPKLAGLRSVRGLRCPVIMLTATLPPTLEFELEASMASEIATYIRAATTRPRTRYIVHNCKAGAVEEEAVALCRRMQKHLGCRKGVVYSRSRAQCERVAGDLRCAYYHAGAADNEERLNSWLDTGGLIVATSALGTGVDFPGVVFVLHIDLPYGMIDFAQESGRAGRAGEDVDSVIMVAEDRVEMLRGQMRGVDDSTMGEFVTTRGCRRRVMSMYLDGENIGCNDGDGGMARCDGCGEGLTALERTYRRAAQERQVVEEMLEELADGCTACWVMSKQWRHGALDCEERDREDVGLSEAECDRMRERIRYEATTHSCHRCGISQRLCATGQEGGRKCQWPNVLVPMLCGIRKTVDGRATLERAGLVVTEEENWGEYGRWVGVRHPRRVWGEVVSNATAVLIAYVLERRQKQGREEEEKIAEVQGVVMEKLWNWRGSCIICRTVRGVQEKGHKWQTCKGQGGEDDDFRIRMMMEGREQIGRMERRGGGGWVAWHGCGEGGGEGCEWCKILVEVAMALLYIGSGGARDWAMEDRQFEEESAQEWEASETLEGLFRRGRWHRGVASNGICELIRAWG